MVFGASGLRDLLGLDFMQEFAVTGFAVRGTTVRRALWVPAVVGAGGLPATRLPTIHVNVSKHFPALWTP